ncbi:MAG: substrate-binding domain-containing protein [Eubacterium sp.]|nr:substrate-binding domain-containing protein [Eubacterium sp.]
MKRKMTAALLALCLAGSLAACGGAADSGSSAADSSASSAVSEAAADSAAASEDADAAEDSAASEDSETDIMVAKSKIEAAADGLGDWESEYSDMAVSGDESFTWGYIDLGYKDTFTTKLRNTFTYYCKLNFPNVEVIEADGEMDPNRQLQIVENFISQGVDCIVLDPADSDGCVGCFDACLEANMPVVCVCALVHHDELNKKFGFVGSDNRQAGELEAKWIIENLDDTETVKMCYQKGSEGYDHTVLREQGVFETLDEAGFNYELVSTQLSDYMRDKALQNAEDWVTAYGDEITCIPCCNDEAAMGTLQAYRAADIPNVSILGIDANQDALQEIANGNLSATVFQNALAQAKWAAASAYDVCVKGGTETRGVDVPFELVDASNVQDYLD